VATPRYQVLAHTADTGIVAYGATLAEVFENAALGMFELMFGPAQAEPTQECRVAATGEGGEELLVAWLSALLTEAEIEGLALSAFTVEAACRRGAGSRVGAARAAGEGGHLPPGIGRGDAPRLGGSGYLRRVSTEAMSARRGVPGLLLLPPGEHR
jgi:SHS2 domain-containing protein